MIKMNEEVYLQNLVFKKTYNDKGLVIGEIVFKNRISLEEYANIQEKKDLILCDKLQNNWKELKKWVKEELQKADSITQSCIFEGKEESTINFRECLNKLKLYKEVIEEVKTEISSLMSKYFYEKDFCIEDIHLDKLLQILDKVKGE